MQLLRADYFAAYRNLKLSRDDKGVLVAVEEGVGYGLALEGISAAEVARGDRVLIR